MPLGFTLVIDDQEVDFTIDQAAVDIVSVTGSLAAAVIENAVVEVDVESPEVDVSTVDQPFTVVTVGGSSGLPGEEGPPGDRGPQGVAGPQGSIGITTYTGPAWWTGEGPPDTVIGSKPGDYYIDTTTGQMYKLGD